MTVSDDAYIVRDQDTVAFGTQPTIGVDAQPITDSLLKFKVDGVADRTIKRVRMVLNTTNPAQIGGDIYVLDDNDWSQDTVTWANAPTIPTGAKPAAVVGPALIGPTIVDVTDLITGDGTYTLRMTSPDDNGAFFSSLEGSGAPVLLISF